MKVLAASNFNDEMFTESFILPFNLSELAARDIANTLNRHLCGPTSTVFYRVVENDYVPTFFEP